MYSLLKSSLLGQSFVVVLIFNLFLTISLHFFVCAGKQRIAFHDSFFYVGPRKFKCHKRHLRAKARNSAILPWILVNLISMETSNVYLSGGHVGMVIRAHLSHLEHLKVGPIDDFEAPAIHGSG